MKSLHEQISSRCIHFTGLMNKKCKAGINYDDVKTGKPLQIPCIKTGGECSSSKFLTDEEIKKEIDEIESTGAKIFIVRAKILDHYNKTSDWQGKIKCVCGGDLHYSIAQFNNHIRAKCNKCGISFME